MAKTKNGKIKLPFETCHSADLRKIFGLVQDFDSLQLRQWTQAAYPFHTPLIS